MRKITRRSSDRRGTVAVIAAIMLVVILGFAALAIDMSWLVSARDQLQAATDNTAVAAARYIVAQGFPDTTELRAQFAAKGVTYGNAFNPKNPVELTPTLPDIVEMGVAMWDGVIYQSRVTGLDTAECAAGPPGCVPTYYDAVHVKTTMRELGTQDQELPGFFGVIFGRDHYEPVAEAIALLKINGGGLMPFAVRWNVWDIYLDPNTEPNQDDWSESGARVPDGIPEIVIYPNKFSSGGGGPACSGNFGTLNIGINNQGLPGLAAQIRYGVSFAELENELGGMDQVEALLAADDGWIEDDLGTIAGSDVITSASADFLAGESAIGPGFMIDIGQGFVSTTGPNKGPISTFFNPDCSYVSGFHAIASVTSSTQLQLAAPLTQTNPNAWYRIHDPNEGFPISGNPGQSLGTPMRDALEDRLGDIVGIFIFDGCDGSGSGSLFNIICIRYAKLLAYQFGAGEKFIVLQPVSPPPDPATVMQGSITYLGLGK